MPTIVVKTSVIAFRPWQRDGGNW